MLIAGKQQRQQHDEKYVSIRVMVVVSRQCCCSVVTIHPELHERARMKQNLKTKQEIMERDGRERDATQ